jgi:hypothetical protein
VGQWNGIRDPACFNDHVVEIGDVSEDAFVVQIAQCHREVAADCAAQATVSKLENILRQIGDDKMIDADFAKLVDDDDRIRKRGLIQQSRE